MSQINGPATSVTPTQSNIFRHGRSLSHQGAGDSYGGRDGLNVSMRDGPSLQDARSLANALAFGPRGASLAPPPGSFSSDLKSVAFPRSVGAGGGGGGGTPKADTGTFVGGDYFSPDANLSPEERQHQIRERINKETKIKIGSENLLEALIAKSAKQTKEQRQKVETELNTSNRKLVELNYLLEDEIEKAKRPTTPPRERLSGLFQGSPLRTPYTNTTTGQNGDNSMDQETESPTFVLGEILQTLELEGMQPDHYIEPANRLVNLFKRYPSLKYDLAWPIFGLRVQTMLLSESREVVAAGYRVTRHSIADRKSLQTIRELDTDDLVVLSLVKDGKASIEREQALKFARAFTEVKGGVHELSKSVVRTIVAVAEHHEDRLRNLSLLTLSELLVQHPALVVECGGIAPLADALVEGTYHGSSSLAAAFLSLEDRPSRRKVLKSGYELDAAFTPFTDPAIGHGHEERLKSSAELLASILKTWPGIFTAARNDFSTIKSLLLSLQYPSLMAKDLILDLLFDILHITTPSWTSSFLAGRRLTTYGRVANMKAENTVLPSVVEGDDAETNFNLVEHYTTLLLAVLMHCGLTQALEGVIRTTEDLTQRRKATLLLAEVLKLADRCLPSSISDKLQVLPGLLEEATQEREDDDVASAMIYQIDSVNRTLLRSDLGSKNNATATTGTAMGRTQDTKTPKPGEGHKSRMSVDMDAIRFRDIVIETQVLATANYLKWRWDLINDMIDGPLRNGRRVDDTIKNSKFMKRLLGFYRPFKYKFSEARNTKPNQRYVRTACALVKTLLLSSEGVICLSESKLLRQLAECLAQLDKRSGLTSMSPLLSVYRVSETLSGGYFAILGALSSDSQGLQMLEKWRMINMFYHIMDLDGREDLVRLLLSNMDFTLDSHLRVMLSKALTACPKTVRIYATRLLRKYATATAPQEEGAKISSEGPEWAIRLLVTQLYDPEVQVSEIAIQILEEVCNRKAQLEYVVKCRPALDHLGPIGAPLLLRFLSTSIGYQYLNGLEYITQEMDDWFLGRNDAYVTLVEASLSKALAPIPERPKSHAEEHMKAQDYGTVPPHFYRELTRTVEGCRLLRQSGHFEAFVSVIQDYWKEDEESELLVKVKGCLWAVGNIGSMELGAPFLEETDVVDWIVKIATTSKVMTMRGTAFYVLGLVSKSLHGMEILAEHGWIAANDHLGRSLGYCLPPTLETLLVIPGSEAREQKSLLPVRSKPKPVLDDDPKRAQILSLVKDLGNAVLTKKAAADLHGIKHATPALFTSISLFRKVMDILESHTFRLPARKFILDTFDKSVLRRVVLDENSDSEPDGYSKPSRKYT